MSNPTNIPEPKLAAPLNMEQKLDKLLVLAVNTSEDVKDMLARLTNVEGTQETHGRALDKLLTEKKTRDESKMVENNRLDQLEKWAKPVGQHLGMEFRP